MTQALPDVTLLYKEVSALKDRDTVRWLCGHIRKRIPVLVIITLTHVLSAILGVLFALGTRWVIDSAVAHDRQGFLWACIAQGALILLTLITLIYSGSDK